MERRLGWQARNEQVTRSTRFESDWDSDCGLVTHSLAGSGGRRGREGEDANASGSGSARARPRGVPTPVVSMDAEKSARAPREERVVFFQSSNLLNLFFPRNVAAVSKLLIAIGKVEPMGWEGSRIERGWQGRAGARGRVA